MLEWEEFEGVFDVLKITSHEAIFGVQNLKENRKSILKLSLCVNKTKTLREIGIMRICQTP